MHGEIPLAYCALEIDPSVSELVIQPVERSIMGWAAIEWRTTYGVERVRGSIFKAKEPPTIIIVGAQEVPIRTVAQEKYRCTNPILPEKRHE